MRQKKIIKDPRYTPLQDTDGSWKVTDRFFAGFHGPRAKGYPTETDCQVRCDALQALEEEETR